ncbi:MAG: NGG1p interacting factor NIF3 [Omnitrophica WOR_2 bacterium GWF2_43_52]|nr:MAG: NGG1p interacting factor NIF3 [Omnitrophica WOR_2 bacterium GWF2_43_52]OGX55986.1 MAG: NGG1p interacting factor NIF3 [Omnitrophica WOR_2 bacterium RIFOXYC2_FULL_43_9]HAH20969.1 NGG1p interacting factor NIF3 [Candidatus Omnitrophota bacterium]HBG63713.1 NGG1p interacting factor NIF3 [Candidatus Omnitrophota bacterium]
MTLKKLYELIVKLGISRDPRGVAMREYFSAIRKEYRGLRGVERRYFDREALTNPFSDTRILYGDREHRVKKILVGIDIEAPEILLADKIREKDGLDLVIAHHPEGIAYAGLAEVMRVHNFILQKLGLHKEVVDDFVKERSNEVARRISSANHSRAVDAARLLNIPFLCCHTPSDNFVAGYLQALLDKSKPKKVGDIMNILYKIPEYTGALIRKAGPKIVLGKAGKKAGKVFVDMTGGTEGPKELFARLSQAGVGTLVCMHLSEEHFAKVKPEHINVVIAGHMASDNLGLNLLFDKIESVEKLDIECCSGFERIRR